VNQLSSVVDTSSRIESPEGVLLELRLAGPGSRLWAFSLDLIIRGIFLVGLAWLLGTFRTLGNFSGMADGLLLATVFVLEWGYGTLFEWKWNGQTPGKRASSLRVVKSGGYPISFSDSALRNFLRFADLLPLTGTVAWISMMLTPQMQRLGDLVADTIVVTEDPSTRHQQRLNLPDVDPLPPELTHRVRRPSERLLISIEQFLRRLPQIGKARADEIAKILAVPLEREWEYVPESVSESYTRFLFRVVRTFGQPSSQPPKPTMPSPPEMS